MAEQEPTKPRESIPGLVDAEVFNSEILRSVSDLTKVTDGFLRGVRAEHLAPLIAMTTAHHSLISRLATPSLSQQLTEALTGSGYGSSLTGLKMAKTIAITTPAMTSFAPQLGLKTLIESFGNQWVGVNAPLQQSKLQSQLMSKQLAQIGSAQLAITHLGTLSRQNISASLMRSVSQYGQVSLGIQKMLMGFDVNLLRGITIPLTLRTDTYLRGLPDRPSKLRSQTAEIAITGSAHLLTVEALTSPGLNAVDQDRLSHELEPWKTGPERARRSLLQQLRNTDPSLPGWLESAWEIIESGGEKSTSLAAHAAVEGIDQTLRTLAPDDLLEVWIASQHGDGFLHDGRPTRKSRVYYVMSQRARSKRDRVLALRHVDSLVALVQAMMSDLQQVKHAGERGQDSARQLLLATESFLMQLLLEV